MLAQSFKIEKIAGVAPQIVSNAASPHGCENRHATTHPLQRLGDEAAWDEAALLEEIQGLAALDFDLSITGFEPNEITGKPSQAKEEAIEVKAVDTGAVQDRFWISVRGPLASQAEALTAMREVMGKIPGIVIELGTTAVEGEKDEWADFRAT